MELAHIETRRQIWVTAALQTERRNVTIDLRSFKQIVPASVC